MKKSIFSVLIADYDQLNQAPSYSDWDAILFTDKKPKDSKGWQIRVINIELSPEKESRKYKFLSHIYLSEYDLVCYMDANMILKKEPPSFPIWFFHPVRRKVFDECKVIERLNKANSEQIKRQYRFYLEAKFKDNQGLFQNGFFVRSNRDEAQNRLMELTFQIVQDFTHRDQIALPFAVWKTNTAPQGLNRRNRINDWITLKPHQKTIETKSIQVHHITPARSDKNFGKAINQLIEELPNEDWICLRDIDTIPPFHEMFIKQVEEIANSPQGFDLIGCMTNRLGLPYQLVDGMFNEFDFLKHREKAKELSTIKKIKGIGAAQTVGGLMMLFSKKTWLKAGKFPEGGIMIRGKFVDYYFSKEVIRFGGKLGIAEGVYLFHAYRMDAENTRTALKHLV